MPRAVKITIQGTIASNDERNLTEIEQAIKEDGEELMSILERRFDVTVEDSTAVLDATREAAAASE